MGAGLKTEWSGSTCCNHYASLPLLPMLPFFPPILPFHCAWDAISPFFNEPMKCKGPV